MTLIRKIENEFTYETDAKTMLNIFMGGEMERKVDQYQLEYDESGMPLDNVGAIIYIKFRCGFAGNYYISPGNLYDINIFIEPEIEHCFTYIGNIYINQTGRESKAVLSFDYGESPDIDLQWFFLPGREIVRKIWRDKIEEWTAAQVKELSQNPEHITQENDTKSTKSKRGPHRYSEDEKINAVKEWDNIKTNLYSGTLEDWLESKFGTTGGVLNVAAPTFHGWRKLLKKS